jgi:Fur family transcriptional regulator, ferric uptake regulator
MSRRNIGEEAVHDAENLKTAGLKVTVPRLRILGLFEQNKSRHWSADEVYNALSREGVDIGFATVYRVLTQFEQAGLLTRHHFENDRSVFELREGGHHDHIVCLQCGRVEEFYDVEIEKRQVNVAAEHGFSIRNHSLYLYGDCARVKCPHKQAATEASG